MFFNVKTMPRFVVYRNFNREKIFDGSHVVMSLTNLDKQVVSRKKASLFEVYDYQLRSSHSYNIPCRVLTYP